MVIHAAYIAYTVQYLPWTSHHNPIVQPGRLAASIEILPLLETNSLDYWPRPSLHRLQWLRITVVKVYTIREEDM